MDEDRIQLITPPDIIPEAKTIMERHGCIVEVGKVTLPAGAHVWSAWERGR